MTHLLDANVLIALVVTNHEHHERVVTWVATGAPVAGCPVVEGALVRFLVRTGESGRTAGEVVRRLRDAPSYSFWPDDLSYGDADLDRVLGHRQVTDAYLAALARSRSGSLVTLDEGLVQVHGDVALLVP